MPRKRLPAREAPARRVTRRSKTRKNGDDGNVPEIYQEMLQEAASSSAAQPLDFSRALKKRKIIEEPVHLEHDEIKADSVASSFIGSRPGSRLKESRATAQQIIYDDEASSDESEVDFEDVELEPAAEHREDHDQRTEQRSLQLDLSESARSGPKPAIQRRKPVSKAERDLRLHVHKWHLLCLLLHLKCRNQWCENDEVQAILKPLVSRKNISLLHVDESKPQFQRVHSFNMGIEELCAMWKREWKITARGIRRAVWKENLDISKEVDEAEDPVDFGDFKEAAVLRSGSRDLGAQLFCALLRSVAVDTRLVCSLQILPFSGNAKGQTPEKARSRYIDAPRQTYGIRSEEPTAVSPTNPRWRNSEYASLAAPQPPAPRTTPKKNIRDSPYPVFWVEVFSPAAMSWIPLDPLVRNTINKPKTGFEPPASDLLNNMSYVLAFEEDGTAKDVTRRYTQFYNAKTRKTRIESTKGGERWWERTMGMFRKSTFLEQDRDGIEDAELAQREANEAMPRNVQDFKGHPIYVLERHLRRNEVLYPRREVGKVNTGLAKGKEGKLESVFRRRDVHIVRSSDQWYRKGRDVKVGEVGLKRAKPKSGETASGSEGEDGNNGSMLYAEFQTDVYEPPPVVRGRIPKNAYGNLDVYVSSMIPAGAIHLQHPDAAKAAKLLGIDYADAVTGFDFKGRQGTAVINGVVVAAEYREAIVEVVQATEYERVQAEEERKSVLMLQMWKRFLTALRIRKRVDEDYGDQEMNAADIVGDEDGDETYRDDDEEGAGGGFMPEDMEQDEADAQSDGLASSTAPMPTLLAPPQEATYHKIVIVESPHKLPDMDVWKPPAQDAEDGVASAVNKGQEPGGFTIYDEQHPQANPKNAPPVNETGDGGGFIPETTAEAEPGGFIVDESDVEQVIDSTGEGRMTQARSLPREGHSLPADQIFNASDHQNAEVMSTTSSSREPPPLRRDSTKDSFLDAADNDAASLLSHDPDDDDKEPDWLVDSD